MNEIKKNGIIKARKLCNIFRFINNLNSINDGGGFETIYCNIYPKEFECSNESTYKHDAIFLDLDITNFQVGLFDKRDSFPIYIVRMSDNSSNAPSHIVYSATGVESLRTARANNNPDSFSTTTNSLVIRMSKQRVPTE